MNTILSLRCDTYFLGFLEKKIFFFWGGGGRYEDYVDIFLGSPLNFHIFRGHFYAI